ncbi:unnamed protein product [Bursaphelenchus xylophilus]|uniref:(pine wood nematode) hypothetical protein n=1 Tax=Bursaphelenchus xylophilus TaxID=6326 RepID=A0A1I7SLC1_BURXY|nr:unnamed protein product [Bursaphelenchus xylophilus]CAG9129484.1 unnamed protein product [Bursaphelenchus xylophilus]
MVEILDPTPAFADKEFIDWWEHLGIQPMLQEVYNQTFTSEFSHRTVKQTYLNLINAHRQRIQRFFIAEDEDEDKKLADTMAELDDIARKEEKLHSHWESLERNSREVMKNMEEYVRECSKATIEIEQKILDGNKQYDERRFFIVREAEKKTVEFMTKRYHSIRIRILQDLRKFLQEKSEEHLQSQIAKLLRIYNERREARAHLSKLRSKLSSLRIRYYSEPVEKAIELDTLRDQVHKNDQEIALLTSELKNLETNAAGMEPIDSVRVEYSPAQTSPIYDVTPVENAQQHKRNRAVSMTQVIERLKVPQMKFDLEEKD